MKYDGATLGQVVKILSYLIGVSSEQVQDAIESGYLSSILRGGSLGKVAREVESKRIAGMWEIVMTLTNYGENVHITVAHEPKESSGDIEDVNKFQLRCWLGNHGIAGPRHVDSGTASGQLLFETRIPERLTESGWYSKLSHAGIVPYNGRTREEFIYEEGEHCSLIYPLRPHSKN